jgi:hypothetical protein
MSPHRSSAWYTFTLTARTSGRCLRNEYIESSISVQEHAQANEALGGGEVNVFVRREVKAPVSGRPCGTFEPNFYSTTLDAERRLPAGPESELD